MSVQVTEWFIAAPTWDRVKSSHLTMAGNAGVCGWLATGYLFNQETWGSAFACNRPFGDVTI